MHRATLVALCLACAAPALAEEGEGSAGPYHWSTEDREAFFDGCRTLTPKAGLCECTLEVFQARYRSIDAFQRSREKSVLDATMMEGQRCADRFGEK